MIHGRSDAGWLGTFAPRAPEQSVKPGPIPYHGADSNMRGRCGCGKPIPANAERCADCQPKREPVRVLCAVCERLVADPATLLCARCGERSHRKCACGATLSRYNPGRRCAPCVERGQSARNDAAEARAAAVREYRERELRQRTAEELDAIRRRNDALVAEANARRSAKRAAAREAAELAAAEAARNERAARDERKARLRIEQKRRARERERQGSAKATPEANARLLAFCAEPRHWVEIVALATALGGHQGWPLALLDSGALQKFTRPPSGGYVFQARAALTARAA